MRPNDPISDLLTRIRNAQKAGHEVVAAPASKIKIGLAQIFRDEGFIRDFKCIRDGKQGVLKIALKYGQGGQPGIREIKRVSTPSCRRYVSNDKIPYIKNGFGIAIVSTSKGLMTDRDARRLKVGGELICSVF